MLAFVTAGLLFAQVAEDISGTYDFEHEGESIQLNLEHGRLEGYISKLGDEVSDRGTPLTFFFQKARVQRSRVTFSTKQVHGLRYSFDGEVVRGTGQRRDDAGYYVLQGTMTLHRIDQLDRQDRQKRETAEQHEVRYRSQRGNT